MSDKVVMSVSELSEYIGVSTDSIYAMVRENQLPFIRVRRRIFFFKESINEWLRGKYENKERKDN